MKNLKREMRKLGISQVEMAKDLEISDSFLSKIVNGWRKPDSYLNEKIANYLECRKRKLKAHLDRDL